MAGFSTYLSDWLLNHYFRTNQTAPTTIYVALNSTMPVDAGTGGVELTGTGYARIGVARGTGTWDAPTAGTGNARKIQNTAVVDYGTAGSDWAPSGTPAVGFTLWDAITAGNYIGGGTFAASKIIQSGDPVKFNAGQLVVSLD